MKATPFLPGLEDIAAPPGLSGRSLALWLVARCPAKREILETLFRMAPSRNELLPTNAAIRSEMIELGYSPPSDDNITKHLRELETRFRLIERHEDRRARSRRRLIFTLGKGVSDRHPRVSVIDTQGCQSSTPKGVSDRHPVIAQVQEAQLSTPVVFSSLNSIQNSEEEKTLTSIIAPAPETPGPYLDHRGRYAPSAIMDRLMRVGAQADAEQAENPVPVAVARAAAAPQHVETVDRLRRLADPCGRESVEAVAEQIAKQLGDEHSLAFHRKVCGQVQSGEMPLKTVVGAYKAARFGTPRSKGAAYTAYLRDHPPPGPARKPTPGPLAKASPGSDKVQTDAPVSNGTRRVNPCRL